MARLYLRELGDSIMLGTVDLHPLVLTRCRGPQHRRSRATGLSDTPDTRDGKPPQPSLLLRHHYSGQRAIRSPHPTESASTAAAGPVPMPRWHTYLESHHTMRISDEGLTIAGGSGQFALTVPPGNPSWDGGGGEEPASPTTLAILEGSRVSVMEDVLRYFSE